MKKILVFFIFVLGAYLLFFTTFKERFNERNINSSFYESFNDLNRDQWFVGEWDTHNAAYSAIFLEDGAIRLPVNTADKGPYLLSKPYPKEGYEVLKVKRRVKIAPGEKYFAGGMALFQTPSDRLRPDKQAALPFGNALLLVEYANGTLSSSTRPGESAFRLLTPGWQDNGNYLVIEPKFNTWIDEIITYNLLTGDVKYQLDQMTYTIKSAIPSEPYIRLWMHSFGHYTGHEITIDSVEIIWMPKAELEESKDD